MFESLKSYLDNFAISIDLQVQYVSLLLKLCVSEIQSSITSNNKFLKFYRALLITIVFVGPIVALIGFKKGIVDIEEQIDSLMTFCVCLNTLVKFMSIKLNKAKFWTLMEQLEREYKECINIDELKPFVMQNLHYSSFFINLIRGAFVLAVIVPIMMPYFSTKKWLLPHTIDLPGISHRQHPGYEICYAISGVGSALVTIVLAAMDSMFCLFTYFIITKYDVTKHYIQHIGDYTYKDNELLVRKCIIMHIETISFMKRVSNIFQPTILIQCLSNGALLPITLFHIKINMYNMSYFLLLATMVDLFLYCFCGQQIIDKAEELADAIYCCQWYNLRKNTYKKDLVIFLANAQAPVGFSAGGLFELTLNTFTQTLKSGFSMCAFIEHVMEDV